MNNIGLDVRYALRRLGAAKGHTVFAIITLAMGIGAATAVFSAVLAIFPQRRIPDIQRVVNIYHSRRLGVDSLPKIALSWPDLRTK